MDVKTLLPAAFAALCVSSTALAQTSVPQLSTLSVTGNAALHVKPDEAKIVIGVVTQESKADQAATENAARLEAVFHALRQAIGGNADIKTISYGLTPDYRSQSGERQPEIAGYTATNTVQVTLDDLQKVGVVIDAATRSGANRIENIQFTLRDPDEKHTEALRQAAANARARADALAAALGLTISRVLTVQEGGRAPIPIRPFPMAFARNKEAARPAPIEAGTLDVNSSVTLTVEVAARSKSAG